MKLTKLQRHTAYILMLVECDVSKDYRQENGHNRNMDGVCGLVGGLCDMAEAMFGVKSLDGLFEILRNKPVDKNMGNYWFPTDVYGWEKRIHLLNQAIQETY